MDKDSDGAGLAVAHCSRLKCHDYLNHNQLVEQGFIED
jgi:hypothetical protein